MAKFYEMPQMLPVIRVLSLTVVLGGINGIQQAYISKKMWFHLFFRATIGGTVCSAFVGVGMAYAGSGYGLSRTDFDEPADGHGYPVEDA